MCRAQSKTCKSAHSKMVNILIKKSSNLKIDINAKDYSGWTAFHNACSFRGIEVVEMMIENTESSKLDLRLKMNEGRTAFQVAELF